MDSNKSFDPYMPKYIFKEGVDIGTMSESDFAVELMAAANACIILRDLQQERGSAFVAARYERFRALFMEATYRLTMNIISKGRDEEVRLDDFSPPVDEMEERLKAYKARNGIG
jgi:ethanolamine utilization protein EutQ (cupin superfamily)